MKKAIVGKKIGMTQVFTDDGRLVPVTVVEAGPCKVVQKKTTESDGYDAVQVGFDTYAETAPRSWSTSPSRAISRRPAWPPPVTCASSAWITWPSWKWATS